MKYITLFISIVLLFILASCGKQEYQVKFLGLNDEVIKVVNVSENEELIYPEAPNVRGYTFTSWDQELTKVSQNTIIKALYEIQQYEVIFFDYNGNIIEKKIVDYGQTVSPPEAPIIENYEFIGWDQDLSKITKDLDVTPMYEKNVYIVTFVDMYGETIEIKTVKENEKIDLPTPPEIKYYTFEKWDGDYQNINDDVTIKALYQPNNKDYQKENVNYWLQILAGKYNIQKELLTAKEIEEYNQLITGNYNKTKVIDVTAINKTITKSELKELIENYNNINKYDVYNTETKHRLTTDNLTEILNNRAIDKIPDEVNVQFGIVTDFSRMRSYPTMHYSRDYDTDRFQETSLNVGEGVAIYHVSEDNNWYFVQAENYNGWVEKENIAICTHEEMVEFLKSEERVVVISDYYLINNAYVRMGQSFPKIGVDSKSYLVSFPTRNTLGNLEFKEVSLPIGNDFSDGYLPYTYENVFKQGFKLLGIDYSWGDKEKNGRDCSSTQNAIYKTFGFMMPRNTSNQCSIPLYSKTVNGVSSNHMRKNYLPGTLIFTSGHVMMYIGEDINGVSYLLHNTSSGDGKCILQPLDEYGGSRIIATLKLQ